MSGIPKHFHVPTLVNVPLVLPLSAEEADFHTTRPLWAEQRSSLFGPLSIENHQQFLDEQKLLFKERSNSVWPTIESFHNAFEHQYILGRGEFKRTVAVKRNDNKLYVVKVIYKNNQGVEFSEKRVSNERLILQSIDCPFCIRLEFFYEDQMHVDFILPFCFGGDLFTFLHKNIKFNEPVSKFYAAQVVLGLEYLHNCDIIYRNLRPENLLLDHFGYLKMKAFQLAKVVPGRTSTFCGTTEYLAPEMIKGKGYGKAVDWWALGVLIYELNTGHPPFISLSSDPMATYKKIVGLDYTMPHEFSDDLQNLIRNLLQTDLTRRLGNLKGGAADIKNHKWFKGMDWLQLLNRNMVPPLLPDIRFSALSYPTLAASSSSMDQDEAFYEF